MAEPRTLARPPITEALVDIQFAREPSLTLTRERLQPLCDALANRFPVVEDQNIQMAQFRIEAGRIISTPAQDLGFRGVLLKAANGQRIAQFRVDGFTFNNVGTYIGGDALLQESLELWNRFVDLVKPPRVTRVALRYINRLNLPLSVGDSFSRFLEAPPELPDKAPQRTSSFLSRIVARDESNATVNVTQKLDRDPDAGIPVVFIDIDVFQVEEVAVDAASLRARLEVLREVKNRTFFALLTEASVSLYT